MRQAIHNANPFQTVILIPEAKRTFECVKRYWEALRYSKFIIEIKFPSQVFKDHVLGGEQSAVVARRLRRREGHADRKMLVKTQIPQELTLINSSDQQLKAVWESVCNELGKPSEVLVRREFETYQRVLLKQAARKVESVPKKQTFASKLTAKKNRRSNPHKK
jgi:hypothetical protein